MSPYAKDKAACFPLSVVDLREGRQPYPVHVQLILSDRCNHACPWCSYRQEGNASNQLFGLVRPDGSRDNNPARMIPSAKVFEILDDCAAMGVRAIQLTGGGEPTIHPDFKAICRTVIDSGMELALVSNGSMIDEESADILRGASWVRISVDAGTPQTYKLIRRVNNQWDRAWNAVRLLAGKTYLGVGFVVMKENWQEVVAAAQLAKEAGANCFRISAAFLKEGVSYFDGFGEEAERLAAQAESLADDKFAVVNFFKNRVADLQQGPPDYSFCGYQHFTTYIGGDLNVYRCCNTAYNARGHVGSLATQRFKELWDSEAKKTAFAAFDAHGCERCQFNGHNKTIARLIARPTSHECFV